MKRLIAALLAACCLYALSASAEPATGVDRLYVLDCGHGHADDVSRWSPGVNVGQPVDWADHCYLIHHRTGGYLLWDAGVDDKIGSGSVGSDTRWSKQGVFLGKQLAAIKVAPSDIKYLGISHTHLDHIGNVEMFPKSVLLLQEAEYQWAFRDGRTPFSAQHPKQLLSGDMDVFDDQSVFILSTPGHTPGHQSLLIHLPKTGWLVLSGDVAHMQSNWDNRRVPSFNTDPEQSLHSMERIAAVLVDYRAKMWINHDKAQSKSLKYAPSFYE